MRFYLAARFDRCDEMNTYAQQLRDRGHVVECRWLQSLHQLHPGAVEVEVGGFKQGDDGISMLARPFAQDDLEDLTASDSIILFSERLDAPPSRGGRHVEFGMALSPGKQLIVIGPRENVFHCLPQVQRYNSWTDFLANGAK